MSKQQPLDVFVAAVDVPASHLGGHPPVLSIGHVANVEETVAEVDGKPDAIFELPMVVSFHPEMEMWRRRIKEREHEPRGWRILVENSQRQTARG